MLDQVVNLFFQVVEEDGVVVDVLQEVLAGCLTVCFELNLAVLIVEVQKGVQFVVPHATVFLGGARILVTGFYAEAGYREF